MTTQEPTTKVPAFLKVVSTLFRAKGAADNRALECN